MSLFASSFESGMKPLPAPRSILKPAAAPSKNQQKRKSRPSSDNQHHVQSAQANLEKVMGKVEKGHVRARRDGTEAMGGAGKAPKPKKTKKGVRERMADRIAAGLPTTPRDSPNAVKLGKRKAREEEETTAVAAESPIPRASDGRLAPAEIPLPHTITTKAQVKPTSEETLTDMQKSMKAKLEGARFRWINEQLYSTPSTEAVAMMKKDPKIFEDYHMTHRALTSAWPSPPLPHLVQLLTPLPAKTVVADLGCGDAGLARALVPQGKIVLSYDLVGDSGIPGEGNQGEGWVVEADFLEHVPLPGRSGGDGWTASSSKKSKGKGKGKEGSETVDAVVCCLSLMGVNWIGGIFEACRILKQGGMLHIAEVTSRFVEIPSFVEVVESFGFKLEHQEAPSTHFTLFRFAKTTAVPQGAVRGQDGWAARVKQGEEILRGCVYKKR